MRIKSGIGLLILLASFSAFADVSFMPAASDKSVSEFLGYIFGDLVRAAGGTTGGGDVFSPIMENFSAAIMLLGGIFLAYTLVAGTMQTAHDGEMLGRKWSTMWVPIRTALGIALIVPVKGGYCIIQVIVMWLALQGVGVANLVWEQYAQTSVVSEAITVQQTSKQAAQVARVRFEQLMCMTSINAETQRASDTARANGGNNIISDSTGFIIEKLVGDAGITTSGTGFSDGMCGSYNFPASTLVGSFGGNYDKAVFGDNATAKAASDQMRQAHITSFNKLTLSLNSITRDMYTDLHTGVKRDYGVAYAKAVEDYDKDLVSAAQTMVGLDSAKNQIAENASKDGWLMAGAWYAKFASLQEQSYTAINQFPELIEPNIADIPHLYKEFYESHKERARFAFGGLTDKKYGVQSQYASDKSARENGFNVAALLHKMFSTGSISEWITNSDSGRNPLLWAQDFGHTVLNVVWDGIALTIAVLAGAGIKVLGNGIDLAPAMMAAMPFYLPLALMGLGFGAMLAYYLPFIPFILFFGAFLGWFIMVIEAVIAAPLWAVMHLSPDGGDGIAGRGGNGYMLILSLVLRPVLMVIGLIAAMTIIYPIGSFFNQVFAATFGMTNGNNFSGIIGFFVLFTIYTMTTVSLVKKAFSLIHVLPDSILRWAGGGKDSELGSGANELESSSSSSTMVLNSVVNKVGHLHPRAKGRTETEAPELGAKDVNVSKIAKVEPADASEGDAT